MRYLITIDWTEGPYYLFQTMDLQEVDKAIKLTLNETIEGLQIISFDWRYIYINNAAAAHGRKSRSELAGRSMMECYPGIENTQMFRDLQYVMRSRQSRRLENEFEFEDGRKCWFELTVEPNSYGILVRSVDITERKRLEEQLRHSQKIEAVGRLAGGVAHDFNNKLSVMLIYCEMVVELTKGTDDKVLAYAHRILEAIQQSSSLTKQLLAFSRKQVLDLKVIDLNVLLLNMKASLATLLGENISIKLHLGETLGNVKVDPSQMDQVILNLCINARDSMLDGGTLTIETANVELDEQYAQTHAEVIPGRYVMLAITDTGTGMDAQVQQRLFEPFFTTKEAGKGTGLGLAMVHGIVKQSRGHIWVYSEPGIGSVFKIYLPQVFEEVRELSDVDVPVVTYKGTETVLLVEDDVRLRAAYSTTLKEAGYTVLAASNPAEAHEMFTSKPDQIGLLLTDLILPETSGVALATKMKALKPELRVIFMSGYTENSIVHKGVLDTDSILLQKPISIHSLLETVRRVLDGKLVKGVF